MLIEFRTGFNRPQNLLKNSQSSSPVTGRVTKACAAPVLACHRQRVRARSGSASPSSSSNLRMMSTCRAMWLGRIEVLKNARDNLEECALRESLDFSLRRSAFEKRADMLQLVMDK